MAESNSKPRLLVVTSTYPRWIGDTEPAFVHQLAFRLTDRFDVVVATSRSPGAKTAEVMDGVQVFRYAYAPAPLERLVYGGGLTGNLYAAPWKLLLLPTYFFCWIWQVAALQYRHRFDVVHAHWFIPGAIVALLAVGRPPLCVTAHGSDVLGLRGAIWRWIRQRVAAKTSAITSVGKGVQDTLHAEGIRSTALLPMGVDLSDLFVMAAHQVKSPHLVFVGRLSPAKRPESALRVFAQAAAVHAGLRLDMVGDGPEQRHLRSLAEELGIDSKVTFHGRLSQAKIAEIYRTATATIITSGGDDAPEGLGLVAIEALGCGCPVISAPNVALQAALPEAAPIRYASDSSMEAITEALLIHLAAPADMEHPDLTWHEQLVRRFDWKHAADGYGRLLESLSEPSAK